MWMRSDVFRLITKYLLRVRGLITKISTKSERVDDCCSGKVDVLVGGEVDLRPEGRHT